jgi:hypothetical protein
MAVLFFSYSHKDEALRDKLEVHLAMLKRQGILETWHDRRIRRTRAAIITTSSKPMVASVLNMAVQPGPSGHG